MTTQVIATDPTKPDWIVSTVTALKDACDYSVYRLRVEGTNLNYPEGNANRKFSWLVHNMADPRYDLTFATVSAPAQKWLDKPEDPFACPKCTDPPPSKVEAALAKLKDIQDHHHAAGYDCFVCEAIAILERP